MTKLSRQTRRLRIKSSKRKSRTYTKRKRGGDGTQDNFMIKTSTDSKLAIELKNLKVNNNNFLNIRYNGLTFPVIVGDKYQDIDINEKKNIDYELKFYMATPTTLDFLRKKYFNKKPDDINYIEDNDEKTFFRQLHAFYNLFNNVNVNEYKNVYNTLYTLGYDSMGENKYLQYEYKFAFIVIKHPSKYSRFWRFGQRIGIASTFWDNVEFESVGDRSDYNKLYIQNWGWGEG